VQQIALALVLRGMSPDLKLDDTSVWVEFALRSKEMMLARLEAQMHRRILKTHLPADALPQHDDVKYIYVARDGPDVAWSLYRHLANLSPDWYEMLREHRGKFGPVPSEAPASFEECYRRWLHEDGYPFWPFWGNVRSWWKLRQQSNVLLVHFNELKKEPEHSVRRISEFLNLGIDEERLQRVLSVSDFEYMKRYTGRLVSGEVGVFKNPSAFFSSGTTGQGRSRLDAEALQEFDAKAEAELGKQCASWLRCGELPHNRGYA